MLLEADAGLSRNSGGIGVDSPEKILDFFLNLPLDDTHVRMARWGCFPWLNLVLLDLVLRFRFHSLPSPKRRPVLSP